MNESLVFKPVAYLIKNISWYAPVYNLAWVLFMFYALSLPPLFVGLFKMPVLRRIQPAKPWSFQRRSYGYLWGAALVIFCFRLIPYWIFSDKMLHFLGGGIAIALVYEYLALNLGLQDGEGMISFRHLGGKPRELLLANLIFLVLFSSFFSVFSEMYEFAAKCLMGYQFDSSGFDTWMDILANMSGALTGYLGLWALKERGRAVWVFPQILPVRGSR
jgi:hypothetical protein